MSSEKVRIESSRNRNILMIAAFLAAVTIAATAGLSAQEKQFAFVFLNPNPNKVELPKDIVDTLQARHMRNLTRMADEGKLIAAGPFYDGGGIFVFGDHPVDSVWAWLNTDPAVRAQRWISEVLRYTPLKGSICRAPKDYTMTTYGYVRVKGLHAGLEADGIRSIMHAVSSSDTLFASGSFPGSGGGILLFRNAPTDSSIAASWQPLEKGISVSARRIYIAKGSFCEE